MSNFPRNFIGRSLSTEKYVIIVKVRIIGRRVKVVTNDNQSFVFQKNTASGEGGEGFFGAAKIFLNLHIKKWMMKLDLPTFLVPCKNWSEIEVIGLLRYPPRIRIFMFLDILHIFFFSFSPPLFLLSCQEFLGWAFQIKKLMLRAWWFHYASDTPPPYHFLN